MLTLWFCHPAHLSAQNCTTVKYLDSVCGSAICIPGERTCFGTTIVMKSDFSRKVRIVPPIPSPEAGISQHPTLFWLLHVTASTDFSAQSTSKRVESKANFPITKASGSQPRKCVCPLPHPALPPHPRRRCFQLCRTALSPATGVALHPKQQGSNL